MKLQRSILTGLTAACAIAIALIPGTASAATPPSDDAPVHEIGGILTDAPVETQAELEEFIASDNPKTVVQDVETADILEAYTGDPAISPLTTVTSPCKTNNLCLRPYTTPYANYGFSGAGTKTGSWPHINRYTTGKWTGKVRVATGAWGPFLSPNTISYFNGVTTITGVQLK